MGPFADLFFGNGQLCRLDLASRGVLAQGTIQIHDKNPEDPGTVLKLA